MTDREPVNIMGVIAFPNPDHGKRMIRFIDSEYHTLFTIKDGESIVITRFDGEKMVFPCKYIDDCHVCIGNSAYHICEFAEMQECNGNTYGPSAPKISDEIGTYEIYQIPATADVDYYFRSYAAAKGKLQSTDYQRSYAGMYAKFSSTHRWNMPFLRYKPLHEMKSETGPFLRKIAEAQKAQLSAAPQERGRQKAAQDAKAAYRRSLAEKRTAERHIVPPPSDRGGTTVPLHKSNQSASVKGGPAPKSGQVMTKVTRTMRVRPTDHAAPNNAIITRRARAAAQRKAQQTMLQTSAKNGGRGAKKMGGAMVQAVQTIGRGIASAASSIVAAIVASPFGILFSNESREAGVVPLSAAVAQVNYDFNERLEALQTADDYDSISVDGQAADWIEVLAVFAVKVAGADVDAADVATMDADRIARLKAVFWDMTAIKTEVETINHPGSGDDDGWTERNLYITITAKTAEEMKTAYHFNRNQIAVLEELLEQRDLLRELIEDVYSVSGDTAALLRDLPEDLLPEREAVVRTACSLVGKVNYFWGGKSLVFGWDARWGEVWQVTAAGSSTTGTYRPYGLDCSGFVDWVFYNQSGGSYVIGHGGGATMQHSYCTDISWSDAQPGDLVFYPDNSHVGIVGGWDANGDLLIIHCASGYNNVVITGKEGFTSISRPRYYAE